MSQRRHRSSSARRQYRRNSSTDADMPKKLGREHRWVALVTYTLTQGQAVAANSGSVVTLDHSNRLAVNVGCLDCEEEFHSCRAKPCDAEPYNW